MVLKFYTLTKIFFWTISILSASNCFAQGKFQWYENPLSLGKSRGLAVYVDNFGSVYSVGYFQDTLFFANQTLVSQNGSGNDGLILKYDSSGNEIWARRITSNSLQGGNYCVAIDGDTLGNIYVTGEFTGTAHFGIHSIAAVAGNDGFLCKLDSAGTFLWVFQIAGGSYDHSRDIKVDESGNSYFIGSYSRSLNFGPFSLNGYQDDDVFVGKVNTNGLAQWVKRAGSHGPGDKHDYGFGIDLDKSGNLYVTGAFKDSCEFSPYYLVTRGEKDIFIVKYNNAGDVIWARRAGQGSPYSTFADFGIGVCVNNDTSIYLSGIAVDGADFGNLIFHTPNTSTTFIAEIDSTGNFKRVVDVSYTIPPGLDIGMGKRIQANSKGDLFFTANCRYPYKPVGNYISYGDAIIKLDSAFNVKWLKPMQRIGGIYQKEGQLYVSGLNYGHFFMNGDSLEVLDETIFTGKLNDAKNLLSGIIFQDVDGDSIFSPIDIPIYNDSILIPECGVYLVSDSVGYWEATVDTGTYTILNITPNGYTQIKPIAPDFYSINLLVTNSLVENLDFALASRTGITEGQPENKIDVFPVPFVNSITIQIENPVKDGILKLYNFVGDLLLIRRISGNRFEVERGELNSGVYFVHIHDGNYTYVMKTIVQ